MKVKNGDKVAVEYEGKLDDGTVFDSSENHGKPLNFEVGAKQVIKGFNDAVIDMETGEEKEIKLKPTEAYGDVNLKLLMKVPKEKLPQGRELKVGMMLAVNLPNGMEMPARISEVGENDVTIDLNHPLAGKNLNFKIKVVGINN